MLCPFYRYIDKRAAYALPPEILTYGDIFYISVPVPIFSQFNFSDAFIVLVVKIYYLMLYIDCNTEAGFSRSGAVFISPESLVFDFPEGYWNPNIAACCFLICNVVFPVIDAEYPRSLMVIFLFSPLNPIQAFSPEPESSSVKVPLLSPSTVRYVSFEPVVSTT
mgnify:CR=1 FL=1